MLTKGKQDKPGKRRVLIVEDSLILSTRMSLLLSAYGYEVIACVHSGADALRAVSKEPPDLLIVDDILMGSRTGIETALEIFKRKIIPAIFLYSNARPANLEEFAAQFPVKAILKPFRDSMLLSGIEQLLPQEKKVVWGSKRKYIFRRLI